MLKNLPRGFQREAFSLHAHILSTLHDVYGGPNVAEASVDSIPHGHDEEKHLTEIKYKYLNNPDIWKWKIAWTDAQAAKKHVTPDYLKRRKYVDSFYVAYQEIEDEETKKDIDKTPATRP